MLRVANPRVRAILFNLRRRGRMDLRAYSDCLGGKFKALDYGAAGFAMALAGLPSVAETAQALR